MNITAIIPVYNGKKYLRQAVESVMKQTLQPLELIVVDDGSTDGSLDAMNGIEADFPIRIFHQQNQGQSSARNHGIRESKGEFIALLDQDDVWYPEHLEKLAGPFEGDRDLGWVYSNLDETDHLGKVVKADLLNDCSFQHPQSCIEDMIGTDMYVLPSASLIQKKAICDVGMFDERLSGYEDDDLFLRLFAKGWKSAYIPESLSLWRFHSNNAGRSFRMALSGSIYAQKIIDNFSLCHSVSAIVGKRFFKTTLHHYRDAIRLDDFVKSTKLIDDLEKYLSLTPSHFQITWKLPLILLKFPRLVKFLLKMRKSLLRRK